MINNNKIKIATKIIVPIIIIAIITIFTTSATIDSVLVKYLKENYIKSLNLEIQEDYLIVKNNYKNLFYNYGKDIKQFNIHQKAVKSETIQELKITLKNSNFFGFIITKKGYIPLKGEMKTFSKIKILLKNKNLSKEYFISNTKFIPWGWNIVIYENKTDFIKLMQKNKLITTGSILLMVLIIITLLIFMSKIFFQNQIDLILKSLKNISEGDYKKISISNIYNSYEVSQLIYGINNMSHKVYFNLYHNTLTGLPNRNALINDIKTNRQTKTLIIINIDAFKEINDFYGHEIGNSVLKIIAKKLDTFDKNCEALSLKENVILSELQKYSKIYHLGGDEFAVLITYQKEYSQTEIEKLAFLYLKKIENKLIKIKRFTISIRVSMGISISKNNLFAYADIALKQAKEKNKNIVFYSEDFNTMKKYKENLKWIIKLEEAIQNNKIICVYQPLFNNQTKKIEKYETLVRLQEDDGSLVPPFFFLEIAKRTKLYYHITKTIITKSFEHFKNRPFSFSVNISLEDIQDEITRNFILDSLQNFPEPKRVVFELLESEEIKQSGEINSFLGKVKQLGAKIAIDDFGTGYSNFSYLLNLNIDILKIDGSLIKNLDTDTNSRAVVHTIINFCSHSNIKVVAEFVDRKEVFDIVTEMGIDYTQGYYISEPKEETL